MLEWLRRWFLGIPPKAYVPRPAHPANVPGSFYVEDGCCISCGVWEDVAPDLLAWTDENAGHCYVQRQPETDDEFERMKRAMEVGEVDCIRVRTCKPQWLARLREDGLGDQIDREAKFR
jgi:hypothetical protein